MYIKRSISKKEEKKMRNKMKQLLVILGIMFLINACGEAEELRDVISEDESQEVLEDVQGNEEETGNNSKPSEEEYTYVFQIGTEPIPVEIAELGGERYKEIYEDTTAIQIGLLEKEMEEDPALKEKVNTLVGETEKYLFDEYGKEFEIVPVRFDEYYSMWRLIAKEKSSGEEFTINYVDFGEEGDVARDGRWEEIIGQHIEQEYSEVVSEIMGENATMRVFVLPVSADEVDMDCIDYNNFIFQIWMISFVEGEIDLQQEQEKIVKLMDHIEPLWKDGNVVLNIEYWPMEYQDIMQKRIAGNFIDTYWGILLDNVNIMKNHGLTGYFSYGQIWGEEDEMQRQVKKYQETGEFSKETWEYWQ